MFQNGEQPAQQQSTGDTSANERDDPPFRGCHSHRICSRFHIVTQLEPASPDPGYHFLQEVTEVLGILLLRFLCFLLLNLSIIDSCLVRRSAATADTTKIFLPPPYSFR